MKTKATIMMSGLIFLGTVLFGGMTRPVLAAGTLVSVTSHASFTTTVAKFKKLVAKNGMMILGTLNQGKVMGMTGLRLKSETFFVGNPTMGKKLFSARKGVGVVIPVRVNIYQNSHGKTVVSFLEPSKELAVFHDPMLVKMGMMMDKNLSMMTGMLK